MAMPPVKDAEALDLIQHYRWSIAPQYRGGWVIEGDLGDQPIELARTRGTLREAITEALQAQARLALA